MIFKGYREARAAGMKYARYDLSAGWLYWATLEEAVAARPKPTSVLYDMEGYVVTEGLIENEGKQ